MVAPSQAKQSIPTIISDNELARLLEEAEIAEAKARISEANAKREEAAARSAEAKLRKFAALRELESSSSR